MYVYMKLPEIVCNFLAAVKLDGSNAFWDKMRSLDTYP